MANDRVINLPANKIDPDSSGTGAMLFDLMVKKPQEAQQADVLAGIEAKHKKDLAAQQNQFSMGMEQLRSQLRRQETEAAWQHEAQLRQQAATGLEGLVTQTAQAGVSLPGLTRMEGQAPEAGYPGAPVANKIEPGAVESARSAYAAALAKHLDLEAQRTGLSTEASKKLLFNQLDLIDDNDARAATALANEFKSLGDDRTAGIITSLYGTAGQGSKTAWLEFQKNGVVKLQTEQARAANRLAISREITQRNKEIAAMRTEAQRATAQTKVDDKSYQRMVALHQAYQGQIAGLDRLHRRVQDEFYIESNPTKQIELQRQMTDIENEMRTLNQEAEAVREKMRQWSPARPEAAGNAPTPGAPNLSQYEGTISPGGKYVFRGGKWQPR